MTSKKNVLIKKDALEKACILLFGSLLGAVTSKLVGFKLTSLLSTAFIDHNLTKCEQCIDEANKENNDEESE